MYQTDRCIIPCCEISSSSSTLDTCSCIVRSGSGIIEYCHRKDEFFTFTRRHNCQLFTVISVLVPVSCVSFCSFAVGHPGSSLMGLIIIYKLTMECRYYVIFVSGFFVWLVIFSVSESIIFNSILASSFLIRSSTFVHPFSALNYFISIA